MIAAVEYLKRDCCKVSFSYTSIPHTKHYVLHLPFDTMYTYVLTEFWFLQGCPFNLKKNALLV